MGVYPSDQDASGRSLGFEEIAKLTAAIESGTLTSTKGSFVRELEASFADRLGIAEAVASSSGTSAIHIAIAALDLEPGDEIITTPITDMGALTPILYQGLIPVFADVDPVSMNLTAATIADRVSDRTRAIVVTHLFGKPAEMGPIMELAERHDLVVIEDCAQAYGAEYQGRPVGTIGAIGCFSLQQGKHITTGEGGLSVTDDSALARRMRLFVNKAWGYGDPQPDHYFLALNYRMNELTGAVAVAQLAKLDGMLTSRHAAVERLTKQLDGTPGLRLPAAGPEEIHAFWKYPVLVDPAAIPGGPVALAAKLRDYDVASAPRYIQKPAFECEVFAEQRTFGNSRWPFTLARPEATDYARSRFPGTYRALEQVLVLPINERYTEAHVDTLAASIAAAVDEVRSGA